jgi:hypothetical protein
MFDLPTDITELTFTGIFVSHLSERVMNRVAAWKQLHLNHYFAKMHHSAPAAFG